MDSSVVISVFAILASLSLATERVVEIVKNTLPILQKDRSSLHPNTRSALVELLSVGAGILTAYLASAPIMEALPETFNSPMTLIALGMLASGGSAMWNSLLQYAIAAKDLKFEEVQQKAQEANTSNSP